MGARFLSCSKVTERTEQQREKEMMLCKQTYEAGNTDTPEIAFTNVIHSIIFKGHSLCVPTKLFALYLIVSLIFVFALHF